LLSGRNPKYLIDEQVKGVKLIKKYKQEYRLLGFAGQLMMQRKNGRQLLMFSENQLVSAVIAK